MSRRYGISRRASANYTNPKRQQGWRFVGRTRPVKSPSLTLRVDILGRLVLTMRITCLLLALVLAATAVGQYPGPYGYGYGGYGHASTLEEGIQRGAADIIRSQGMAALQNAQAATEFEQARHDYLDNRLKATQTYFEMRKYNDEARRAKDTSPLSMEQYVRIARQQAPDSLVTSQLDPLTGSIGWPVPLKKPEYETLRKKLETLFQQRASGYADYAALSAACAEFLERLKTDLQKFDPNDYVKAKKFLDSLAYAARATPT